MGFLGSSSIIFIGLAYQGKDIVFRFITEYSSLRDFGPYIIDLFLYEDFWKMIFWVVLKLETSYRVVISWRILVSFIGFSEDYIFAWWKLVVICWNRYSNFFLWTRRLKNLQDHRQGVRCNFWHLHNNGVDTTRLQVWTH